MTSGGIEVDRVMQDLLAVGGEIKVDIDLSREKAIPDCLPNYAAWERTLEVDRAVRVGMSLFGLRNYFPPAGPVQVGKWFVDAPVWNRRQGVVACILQAWREQHQ